MQNDWVGRSSPKTQEETKMNNQNNNAKALTLLMVLVTAIAAGKTAYKIGVQDGKNDIIKKASRPAGLDVTNNKIVQEKINIKASPTQE